MISFHKTLLLRLTATGLQFLISLIIASWAGTNDFGALTFMITNGALFIILTNLGGDASLIWHGASRRIDPEVSVALAYRLVFFQAIVYVLLLVGNSFISETLWISHQPLHDWPFECLYIFALIIGDKFVALFYARHKSFFINLLQVLAGGWIILGLIIIQLHWFSWSLSVLQTFCLFTFLQSILILLTYHVKYGISSLKIHDRSLLRSIWHFSLLILVTNLIQFFAYRLDYWLLQSMKGFTALGVYAQACRFSQLLWVLPQAMATLLVPQLLQLDNLQQSKLILRSLRLIIFASMVLIPSILIVSELIYDIWMPTFYIDLSLISILLLGSFLFALAIIVASLFSAKRMLWLNFICSSICFVSILVGDVLLIPAYGIKGAAMASCISYGLSGTIYLGLLRKYVPFEWKELWKFSKREFLSWIPLNKTVIE